MYLVNDRCDDLLEYHFLVSGWREDLVELVGLVAERAGTHGEIHNVALDTVGRDNNTAVFAHFAVIATTASNNDIDVGLLSGIFEICSFPLEGR